MLQSTDCGQSIILSPHQCLRVFQVVPSFMFSHQNPVWISLLPSTWHMALQISSALCQNPCTQRSEWKYEQWSSSYLSHSTSRLLSTTTRISVLQSYSKMSTVAYIANLCRLILHLLQNQKKVLLHNIS